MEEDLYTIRKRKGYTLKALSAKSGVYFLTIHNAEQGKFKPNQATRKKLETALGCKIDWFSNSKIKKLPESDVNSCVQLFEELVRESMLLNEKDRMYLHMLISKYFMK